METPPTMELTVDLDLWQEGSEVTVEVPAAVTVGHVADQLALFVGQRVSVDRRRRAILVHASDEPVDGGIRWFKSTRGALEMTP